MATIAQNPLFGWRDVGELGDLERLRLVLEYLPDEPLMRTLEQARGRGRDEYPVRAMWNTLLAGIVFGHESVASLRRELLRNAQLRELCGLDPLAGVAAVAPGWVYTRFMRRLLESHEEVEAIFDRLVDALCEELPEFGRVIAVDGKAIGSHARGGRQTANYRWPPGRRRDADADWGVKSYRGERQDGSLWETVKRWFGYELHLMVDAAYELPLAFSVTRASAAEAPEAHRLLDAVSERHPEILSRCETFCADKGYDDGKLIRRLWDEHRIKPVVDIRNCRQDGEESRLVEGTENVVYTYRGEVCCVCPQTGTTHPMAYGGFEADRETLKYRCPARHYGYACAGAEECPIKQAVRIPLSEDRRVFTPLARSSYAWQRAYARRSAVERVNGRLDVSFGFERHFIRGQAKMRLRCTLALSVMLAMALGRIREQQASLIRSLVRSA